MITKIAYALYKFLKTCGHCGSDGGSGHCGD
jgi:hypothetical protein